MVLPFADAFFPILHRCDGEMQSQALIVNLLSISPNIYFVIVFIPSIKNVPDPQAGSIRYGMSLSSFIFWSANSPRERPCIMKNSSQNYLNPF